MKLLWLILGFAAVAAQQPKNPHKLRLKEPVYESSTGYKSLGWRVKYPAFCRCQREIHDSFEGLLVAPRIDLVTWSRCDEFADDKRNPQISYQGSYHQKGWLSVVDENGAYSVNVELAKEIAAKDKSKASRRYFEAGDRAFKFTRISEWNFDMHLDTQTDKNEAFKESFTMKTLNKLSDKDQDKLLSSLLQSTIEAYSPDTDTTPGKLKALFKQCQYQLGVEEDPNADPIRRLERLKKDRKKLELLRETYTTCFKSQEIAALPDSPFALIENCLESVK